ncbi:MAG: AAA family ATPase [Candidatus Acidiferrum sp.]
MDHEAERKNEVATISQSTHRRKVIVAGPGTGKSYLFKDLINKKKSEGKSNFLAITFIGKLRDALADELCGLAETTTIHAFARSFVFEHLKDWSYYPRMYELISEDLKAEGVGAVEVGDPRYAQKTKHYRAVGTRDSGKTPGH